MLTSLSFETPSYSAPPDALGLLLDGHERTRRFSALAQRLGEVESAPPAQLRETATQLLRYFTSVLPLHVDDEDQSLTPMLLETGLSRPHVRRLWELGRQHEAIGQQLYALEPLWAELCRTPAHHALLAVPLAQGGRWLVTLMEEHLALEEEYLFPLARERLSAKQLMALMAEMRHRRRGVRP
jgi:iron-sulfur cluster repair protein YtfE (RIC family)